MSTTAIIATGTWSAPAVPATAGAAQATAPEGLTLKRFLLLCLLHIVLAYAMRHYGRSIATAQALAAFFLIFSWSLFKPLQVIAYGAAYIVGAEVLWRMNAAGVFWEFGKYATVLILLIGMMRARTLGRPGMGLFYILLMIPSALIPLTNLPFAWARREVSFNLSGPLVLALAAWFFTRIRMSRRELMTMLLYFLIPVIGISFLGVDTIANMDQITFSEESNAAAAGGYAPNQVSTVLGLGALACFLVYLLADEEDSRLRLLMLAGTILLAGHCAVTLSRGGLYAAGIGIAGAGVFFLQSPGMRERFVKGALLVAVVGALLVVPFLNRFTQGMLVTRFESTATSGRLAIMEDELEMWRHHFLLGVGPGKMVLYLQGDEVRRTPHTEFTRVLADHGFLGLVALLLLVVMGAQATMRAPSPQAKGIVVGLGLWTASTMMSAAMRLAAPGLFFGLAMATFILADYRPPGRLQHVHT